jgi:hypothetical protein
MMDWISVVVSSAVGGGMSAVASVVRSLVTEGKHSIRLDRHDEQIKETTARLEALDDRYVPRRELEQIMLSMQASLNRVERWMENLLLKRGFQEDEK